jgi:hypothetical protein
MAAAAQRMPRTSPEQAGRMEAGIERLEASLDAAQDAAKALRRDMSRGSRDIAKNVETMLAATRKDTTKLAKAVRRDLADLQKAMTSPPAATPRGARRAPAKRPAGTGRSRSGPAATRRARSV